MGHSSLLRRVTAEESISPAEAILDHMPDAVLAIGQGLLILKANHAAQAFFGLSTLAGQRLDAVLPNTSPLCLVVRQVFETGQNLNDPHFSFHLRKANEKKEVALHLIPMNDLVIAVLKAEGLTHRLDREYKHRLAIRSFQMMASYLAHEIKNPLSGIKGAARLLSTSVTTPEDKSLAALIEEEATRIHRLTDKVAFFSDHAPPALQPVNLHMVLEHVRNMAVAGFASHVDIKTSYDPSLPEVLGDQDQLIQIFLNLIKNAAEAVPENGGEITLKTFYNHGAHVGSVSRARLGFGVTVEDNGSGIPESIKNHLFEPFHTTKSASGGSGIGLALCAKIIDDHDGAIEVKSVPARTVFSVYLPFANERFRQS